MQLWTGGVSSWITTSSTLKVQLITAAEVFGSCSRAVVCQSSLPGGAAQEQQHAGWVRLETREWCTTLPAMLEKDKKEEEGLLLSAPSLSIAPVHPRHALCNHQLWMPKSRRGDLARASRGGLNMAAVQVSWQGRNDGEGGGGGRHEVHLWLLAPPPRGGLDHGQRLRDREVLVPEVSDQVSVGRCVRFCGRPHRRRQQGNLFPQLGQRAALWV